MPCDRPVITSYSIHYTKLYEALAAVEGRDDAIGKDKILELMAAVDEYIPTVITSYSIHYTKLYDIVRSSRRRVNR